MAERVDCNLALEEKLEMVWLYSISQNNARQSRKLIYQKGVKEKKWNEVGVEKAPIPSVSTIHRVNKMFDESGCVSKMLVRLKTCSLSQKKSSEVPIFRRAVVVVLNVSQQ